MCTGKNAMLPVTSKDLKETQSICLNLNMKTNIREYSMRKGGGRNSVWHVSKCGCSGLLVWSLFVITTASVSWQTSLRIIIIIGFCVLFIACWELAHFTAKLHEACAWMVVPWDNCPDHRRCQFIFYNMASWSTKLNLTCYRYIHRAGASIICRTVALLRPDARGS